MICELDCIVVTTFIIIFEISHAWQPYIQYELCLLKHGFLTWNVAMEMVFDFGIPWNWYKNHDNTTEFGEILYHIPLHSLVTDSIRCDIFCFLGRLFHYKKSTNGKKGTSNVLTFQTGLFYTIYMEWPRFEFSIAIQWNMFINSSPLVPHIWVNELGQQWFR